MRSLLINLNKRFRLWGSRVLRVGMNIACVNFSLDKKRLSPPRLWPCQQLFTFFLGQRFKTVIMSNIPVEKKSRKTRNTLKTESSVIELLGSFCFLLQLSWRREVAPKYISGIARSIACCMLPSSRTITDFQSILQTYCLETWPESRSSGVFSSVVPNLIAVSRIEIWGRGECEPWTRKARGVMVKMIPRLIKAYIKAWPCENKNILAPWIIFICHVAIICWYIWDSSVQFSRSIISNSLRPHGLQHARLPCPSPAPGVYSNSCPLREGCHPTISSSVIPVSPFVFNLSQHQGLFQWVSSSHQVAKVLEFQLQHQSFQWIFRTDFL